MTGGVSTRVNGLYHASRMVQVPSAQSPKIITRRLGRPSERTEVHLVPLTALITQLTHTCDEAEVSALATVSESNSCQPRLGIATKTAEAIEAERAVVATLKTSFWGARRSVSSPANAPTAATRGTQ